MHKGSIKAMVIMKESGWLAAIDSRRNLMITDYVTGEVKMVGEPCIGCANQRSLVQSIVGAQLSRGND